MSSYFDIPNGIKVGCDIYEYLGLQDIQDRRLYLNGVIAADEDLCSGVDCMTASDIVNYILQFNREDSAKGIPPEDRKPIRLYINSPGGNTTEGFPLISVIELSKTPVYTINIGEWSSMAFLIGIAGHRRYSLPRMTFLMHDGSNFIHGSSSKVQDTAKFNERVEKEIVKIHVLKYSRITEKEYDKRFREEWYMLPEDALKNGFIDEIVTDINAIL